MLKYRKRIESILIWIGIYVYVFNLFHVKSSFTDNAIYTLLFTLNLFLVYYCITKYLFKLVFRKKYFYFAASIVLVFLSFFILEMQLFKIILPFFNIETSRVHYNLREYIMKSIMWFFFISIFAYANLMLLINRRRSEKISFIKSEYVNFELGLLSNQFHSHLTFNFLNQCYLHLTYISDDVAEIVDRYSSMLRYSMKILRMNETSLKNVLIYINDYIYVYSKLSNVVNIKVTTRIENENRLMDAMVLPTVIEFCLNHIKLSNTASPIEFIVEEKDNSFKFFALIDTTEDVSNIEKIETFQVFKELLAKNYSNYELSIKRQEYTVLINFTIFDK